MPRSRLAAAVLAVSALVAAAPAAIASGGGTGGGSPQPCLPLAMTVQLAHADINGRTGIVVTATIRNCAAITEPLKLTVSVPGSSTIPFSFSAPFPAGASLTKNASPIGSTPSQLQYGQTYKVVGTLTQPGVAPVVISTITATVTMPLGPVR